MPAATTRFGLGNDDPWSAAGRPAPHRERLGIPLVYDVHHHRCHPDAPDVADATHRTAATWGVREPYFHISSPRAGRDDGDPRPHADYVIPSDFPDAWRGQPFTVDVEARAKERAMTALRDAAGPAGRARA